MPYAEGRTFNDADAHIMEPANWLAEFADPGIRPRIKPLDLAVAGRLAEAAFRGKYDARHWDEVAIEKNLMQIKGWEALGAFDRAERTRALDLLGFNRQLVFTSLAMSQFWGVYAQREHDLELVYGGARAVNRGITDFCKDDRRLIPVGFLPLDDPERAEQEIEAGLRLGCGSFWIPATPAGDKSPTHHDYDGVWSRLQEANVPFMLHVGVGPHPIEPAYRNNGRPREGFAGGGEALDSKDFMLLHMPAEAFLSAMVLDGTFEQFSRLRCGVIELGALWLPSWLRRLDVAQTAFARTEPALTSLKMRPSEYVRRQIKFTPYPHEPVGWIIQQAGEEILMISSDYPHIEGGRNPIKRFEDSMRDISDEARERFYAQNFSELIG